MICLNAHQKLINGELKKAMLTACILGGTGFVGSRLAGLFSSAGYRTRIPTRRRERYKDRIILLPNCELINADISDPLNLEEIIRGTDIVINCVGILHENRKNDFEKYHVTLVKNIVEACIKNKIPRFIQVSALKASPSGPSKYLRSKGDAERIIRQAANVDFKCGIIRPSVIFGPGDSFLTMFQKSTKFAPLLPLASPHAKFQPIFIGEVVEKIFSLARETSEPLTEIDLCGPRVYTLLELVKLASSFNKTKTIVMPLNETLSYLQAFAMELSPIKLLTRDNLRSMSIDNVCDSAECSSAIGMVTIEEIAPSYLG